MRADPYLSRRLSCCDETTHSDASLRQNFPHSSLGIYFSALSLRPTSTLAKIAFGQLRTREPWAIEFALTVQPLYVRILPHRLFVPQMPERRHSSWTIWL